MRITQITPQFVHHIPEKKEEGILYISKEFEIAIHLCACGCGRQSVTPLNNDHWGMAEVNGKVTLRPSIGNFMGQNPYHAHYFITNNKIEWA